MKQRWPIVRAPKRPMLLPLVPLYAAGVRLREWRLDRGLERIDRLRWPVISVGNISTGGSGKTPFTIALAKLLGRHGFVVDVLSRGYGRQREFSHHVGLVDRSGKAEQFGDEPLLIAQEAHVPVFVGTSRLAAGQLAEELFAEQELAPQREFYGEPEHADTVRLVHLLDDGFQHRQLARDLDIVLINSDDLVDWLLPAGNLRESVRALRRASILAVPVGDDAAAARLRKLGLGEETGQALWRFKRTMLSGELKINGVDWKPSTSLKSTQQFVAFCGVARPGQFFQGLETAGFSLAARHVFRDHHRFRRSDLDELIRSARDSRSVAFLTTGKDRVRLGPLAVELAQSAPLIEVGLKIDLEGESQVASWLAAFLEQIKSRGTN